MQVRKNRWSKVYESSEEELVALLQARGITATRREATQFEQQAERTVDTPTDIYLAEGSATFRASGQNYSMQPGDALHCPSNTALAITAGLSGCVYYET